MGVQTLRSELAIEAFDERIVRRFAGPAEIQLAGALQNLDNVLASIREPWIDHRREPGERIYHRQNAQLAPHRQLIVHEVHSPCLGCSLRCLAILPQLGRHE